MTDGKAENGTQATGGLIEDTPSSSRASGPELSSSLSVGYLKVLRNLAVVPSIFVCLKC